MTAKTALLKARASDGTLMARPVGWREGFGFWDPTKSWIKVSIGTKRNYWSWHSDVSWHTICEAMLGKWEVVAIPDHSGAKP